jgi:hypothetical protein
MKSKLEVGRASVSCQSSWITARRANKKEAGSHGSQRECFQLEQPRHSQEDQL